MKIKIIGFRDENGCTLYVDGKKIIHQVKHSPTGLEFGYFGSGPADTARSILLQVLQDNAKELNLLKSQAKDIAEKYYQQFKFDFVGDWRKDMFKTEIDITQWLRTKGAIV